MRELRRISLSCVARVATHSRLSRSTSSSPRNIDGAIALLSRTPELRDADVVLLQEMDSSGTERIANALGMWHVYYPAIYHRRTRRDFGNAVLSRFPIVEDRKIILPHASRYARTHRIATAATIQAGSTEDPCLLYSPRYHLGHQRRQPARSTPCHSRRCIELIRWLSLAET